MADLRDALGRLPDGRDDVLRHAARWVAQRLAHEQAAARRRWASTTC